VPNPPWPRIVSTRYRPIHSRDCRSCRDLSNSPHWRSGRSSGDSEKGVVFGESPPITVSAHQTFLCLYLVLMDWRSESDSTALVTNNKQALRLCRDHGTRRTNGKKNIRLFRCIPCAVVCALLPTVLGLDRYCRQD